MRFRRYVLGRIAWTGFAAWVVMTVLFFAYAYAPDPGQYRLMPGWTSAYRAARNYDQPLLERYLLWMERFFTLDFGHTIVGLTESRPIGTAMLEGARVSAVYVVPALVLAVVLGVGLGVYAAGNRDGPIDRLVRSLAYGGFALPTFVAAEVLFLFAVEVLSWYTARWDPQQGLFTARNLGALVFPGLIVAANALTVQLRYARAESLEHLQADFVRVLRANGARPVTVLRHVLRNAAAPLLALFVSEVVGVLFVVVVVVEVVFGIPGFGALIYQGINQRDIGLILSTTMVSLFVVLIGNLLQDVLAAAVDPRWQE